MTEPNLNATVTIICCIYCRRDFTDLFADSPDQKQTCPECSAALQTYVAPAYSKRIRYVTTTIDTRGLQVQGSIVPIHPSMAASMLRKEMEGFAIAQSFVPKRLLTPEQRQFVQSVIDSRAYLKTIMEHRT